MGRDDPSAQWFLNESISQPRGLKMGIYIDSQYKKLRIQYTDWTGVRRTLTPRDGTTELEAVKLFNKFQNEHDDIRIGLKPKPRIAAKKTFTDTLTEYLNWGNACGGKRGMAWSPTYKRERPRFLKFWQKRLGITMLADLEGILPRVDKVLQEIQRTGVGRITKTGKVVRKPLHGKTLNAYIDSLGSFCQWCIDRNYLTEHPLKGLSKFHAAPATQRRALTIDEIQKLLESAPSQRALIYETAIFTGLRSGELRKLTVGHLDITHGAIRLDVKWTKNRKGGSQQVPARLLEKLTATTAGKPLTAPLLSFEGMSHPERALELDLEKIGSKKWGPGGKADFHSLRTTFVSLVCGTSATVKESMELARHTTPNLTMNTYARANNDRLSEIVENISQKVCPQDDKKRMAVGAENDPKCIELAEVKTQNIASNVYYDTNENKVAGSSPVEPAIISQKRSAAFLSTSGQIVPQPEQQTQVIHSVLPLAGKDTATSSNHADTYKQSTNNCSYRYIIVVIGPASRHRRPLGDRGQS